MKLAALAFVRKNKRFSIITDRQLQSFVQENAPNFIKNGQPQSCLKWKGERINIEKYNNKVTIEITPIALNEWIPFIDNFLWLTQRNVGRINVKDQMEKLLDNYYIINFFIIRYMLKIYLFKKPKKIMEQLHVILDIILI